MQIVKIPFSQINELSFKDKFYQEHFDKLKQFLGGTPDLEGLKNGVQRRSENFPVDRTLLHSVLQDHYSNIKLTESQKYNIERLKDDNTFTIITAHQPSLLAGPAYYFYKIFSVINLCLELKEKMPLYHFVPVFINGSEDHDFDEVKSVHMYGKTIEWDTDQIGPVGRFSTKGLNLVLKDASDILGNSQNALEINKLFSDALENSDNYNEFVFKWLNKLLGSHGLIIVNMDDKRFKKAFSPTMKKEITERKSIELVQNTQTELSGLGFRPQAFAREINLFYMENGTRERIIYENRVYRINNTELTFSEDELINQIDEFPDKFSPNVVMRPIYQEFILPNIAYIGGGGEISYWVERKTQFEYFGVYFPVLIRRNSVMILTKSIQKLMDKLEVNLQALLQDENNLINLYLEKVTNADFHLLQETEQINSIFDIISEKARMIDPTLGPYALSEGQKVIKSIDAIEARLKKTIKHKEETSINQLKNLRSKLFPDGGLQERTESFLQYIVSEGFGFQEKLIEICDPLQKEFLFIYI